MPVSLFDAEKSGLKAGGCIDTLLSLLSFCRDFQFMIILDKSIVDPASFGVDSIDNLAAPLRHGVHELSALFSNFVQRRAKLAQCLPPLGLQAHYSTIIY